MSILRDERLNYVINVFHKLTLHEIRRLKPFALAEHIRIQYCPAESSISSGAFMNLKYFLVSIYLLVIIYTSASLASQPDTMTSPFSRPMKSPVTCVGTCFIFDYDAKTVLQKAQITSDSLDGLNQNCVIDAGKDIHPWVVRDTSCN
jgi:hypothetical protein